MIKNYTDITQNQYLIYMVKSLHMDIAVFMHNLSHGDRYEYLIHKWAIKLYQKGVSKELGLKIIYRARMVVLMSLKQDKNTSTEAHKKRPMFLLKKHPTYRRLSDKKKKRVIKKIEYDTKTDSIANSINRVITESIHQKEQRSKKKRSFVTWFL